MKVISKKEKLEQNMKGILWHGVTVENAVQIFKDNHLKPYTSQRLWDGGIYLKEDHPDYEKSHFMYGWCMSRDRKVSESFGEILFVFEKNELRKNMKVKPYAWNFSLANGVVDPKREREEFVLSGGYLESLESFEEKAFQIEKEMEKLSAKMYSGEASDEEFDELQDKYNTLYDKWETMNFHEKRKKPHGKVLPLTKSKGFYIRKTKDYLSMNHYREHLDEMIKHPMFLGFLD